MLRGRSRPEPITLLAGAAIGVYLLVIAGATASLADAARACQSWPGCSGSLGEPGVAIALGHRVAAAVVGILVLVAAVSVLWSDAAMRVKAATAIGLGLFPIQIGFGAVVATTAGTGIPPGVHLAAGMSIFGALVLALAWKLEARTGIERGEAGPAAVAPKSAGAAGSGVPSATAETAGGQTAGATRSWLDRLRTSSTAYFRLMKPRLMWLLCLVAAAGMALAAGPDLTVPTIVFTLGGGILAIGASGTFNHVLERDRDKKMERTADRPVATYEVPVRRALAFGATLVLASLLLFLQVNVLAAALGLAAILFYSVVYTLLLKPNTVQNTVIGGLAGALPAVIGWVAATGRIGLPGLALAGLVFAWTPAHFYNLALAYKEDYERGGFPMMPVVRGETTTRKHILLWLGATLVSAGALLWMTELSWLTAAATVVFGAVFFWTVLDLHREQTDRAAFRAFHASNAYLGVVLLAIVVDALAL